jgi:beta-lactam-binding protein with PASTA domain
MIISSRLALVPAIVFCSCASIAKTVGYERQGDFAMPDVTNKTADEAKDALATSGITGSVDVRDNEVCPDLPVQETHVCFTSPRAGAMTNAHLPVTIYLRAKEPAFYAMPNIMGMTADEAKQKLISLGQNPKEIHFETISGAPDPDCVEDHVCKQSPPAGDRTPADMQKYVGLGPHGAHPRQPATAATTTTSTSTSTSTKPETKPATTKPDPTESDAAKGKKPDDAPAPLF